MRLTPKLFIRKSKIFGIICETLFACVFEAILFAALVVSNEKKFYCAQSLFLFLIYLNPTTEDLNFLRRKEDKIAITMDKLKLTRQYLSRVFNFKWERVCLYLEVMFITKTARIKVENSVQTTFRFSPVSYRGPWMELKFFYNKNLF